MYNLEQHLEQLLNVNFIFLIISIVFVKGGHSSEYTICPYVYNWKVSNPKILEVQGPSESDSARFINIKGSGETTLTVEIVDRVSTSIKILST